MTRSMKFKGFTIACLLGLLGFTVLSLKMNPDDLITLCQFYFGYNGIITGGFFGFRFGEQWANAKK